MTDMAELYLMSCKILANSHISAVTTAIKRYPKETAPTVVYIDMFRQELNIPNRNNAASDNLALNQINKTLSGKNTMWCNFWGGLARGKPLLARGKALLARGTPNLLFVENHS